MNKGSNNIGNYKWNNTVKYPKYKNSYKEKNIFIDELKGFFERYKFKIYEASYFDPKEDRVLITKYVHELEELCRRESSSHIEIRYNSEIQNDYSWKYITDLGSIIYAKRVPEYWSFASVYGYSYYIQIQSKNGKN